MYTRWGSPSRERDTVWHHPRPLWWPNQGQPLPHSQFAAAQTRTRRTTHIFGSIRPLFEDIRPWTSDCLHRRGNRPERTHTSLGTDFDNRMRARLLLGKRWIIIEFRACAHFCRRPSRFTQSAVAYDLGRAQVGISRNSLAHKSRGALGRVLEVAGPPSAALHWQGPIRPKQLSAVCTLSTTTPFVSWLYMQARVFKFAVTPVVSPIDIVKVAYWLMCVEATLSRTTGGGGGQMTDILYHLRMLVW